MYIKQMVKNFIARLAVLTGLDYYILSVWKNKGVYIVCYHSITNKSYNSTNSISVNIDDLCGHLQMFRKYFRIISIEQAYSLLSQKEKLNENYLVITFDDGYRDNFDFRECLGNLKPTVYLTSGCISNGKPIWTEEVDYFVELALKMKRPLKIDNEEIFSTAFDVFSEEVKKRLKSLSMKIIQKHIENWRNLFGEQRLYSKLMNWHDVCELSNIGWVIGGHTSCHVNLAAEDSDTAESEMIGCADEIANNTGFCVEHFAYPYGKFEHISDQVVELCSRQYKTAVMAVPGINYPGDNLYLLKRFVIGKRQNCLDILFNFLKQKIKNI